MRYWTLPLSCLLLFSSCSKNPVTGESELTLVSEAQEIQLGESNYELMQQGEGGAYVTIPEIQKYVQKVGLQLAKVSDRPQLPYEFVVLNNSIPNAWALPGGKIGINRGLLVELKTEAELAAVLGHEIVHSAARHSAKQLEKSVLLSAGLLGMQQVLSNHKYEDVAMGAAAVGAGMVMMKYSRKHELEADKYGIKYMVLAGYNPQAAVDLQKTFLRLSEGKQPNWLAGLFATHPPSQERIDANQETVNSYPSGGKVGAKDYEAAMAPLMKVQPAYDCLNDGYKALKKKDAAAALSLAKKGIKIEPQEAHLYNLEGKAEVKLKQFHDALASFNKAISLNPNYYDFYLERGQLKYQMKDSVGAKKDLDKSKELLPSAEAYLTLGYIALDRGNRD